MLVRIGVRQAAVNSSSKYVLRDCACGCPLCCSCTPVTVGLLSDIATIRTTVAMSSEEPSKDPVAAAFMALLGHLNRFFASDRDAANKFHGTNDSGAGVL